MTKATTSKVKKVVKKVNSAISDLIEVLPDTGVDIRPHLQCKPLLDKNPTPEQKNAYQVMSYLYWYGRYPSLWSNLSLHTYNKILDNATKKKMYYIVLFAYAAAERGRSDDIKKFFCVIDENF